MKGPEGLGLLWEIASAVFAALHRSVEPHFRRHTQDKIWRS